MVTQEHNDGWPVSTTGGKKVTGAEAAKILQVSYSQLYKYLERGEIMRADRKRGALKKHPLVFFLQDVVALGLEYGKLTEEQADQLLHPNEAAATTGTAA